MVGKQKVKGSVVFDKDRFGAFIKARRRIQGLSQPDLAKNAGLAKQVVSNLETGRVRPTVETICLLAAALDMPPADLLQNGIVGGVQKRRSELDRAMELFARFTQDQAREAIVILEAVVRIQTRVPRK